MQTIISPCGLNCSACPVYTANITPELQEQLAANTPFKAKDIDCAGCKDGNPCIALKLQGKDCPTQNCALDHGVDYCFECPDFPCAYLMPTAAGAETYPHNTKLFNLCLMQKLGIGEWIRKSEQIRDKYFTTKFEIGKGASDD